MSYSRFGFSRFYTYPMEDGDGVLVLCVDCDHYFTYDQLKNDMEKCLDEAATPTDNPLNAGYGVPLPQLREELREYMQMFMWDVERGTFKEVYEA